MVLLHIHHLTDITTYLHDCSDIYASHTIIYHNIPNTKLEKTNMLAGTAGSRFNNRLKPYSSFQLSPGKENKRQKDAEALYHFQNLFLSFFCLHQIEQTNIGTCKVNTLWCFFITIQIQLDKDWISIFFFLLQT